MAAFLNRDDIVVFDLKNDSTNTVEVGCSDHVIIENPGKHESSHRKPVWTRESTFWLMEEMRQFELRADKHKVKKRTLYEELSKKFAEANFFVNWEAVQKKWQNLMSTYWRTAKKLNTNGEWEYLKEMDSILCNTSVWVGLNGCKDPNQTNSLHYTNDQEDRLWNNERIMLLLGEMQNLPEDTRSFKPMFYRVASKLGVDVDWKTVQKKYHNLLSTYRRNVRKPRNEVSWELFDAMDSIMQKSSVKKNIFEERNEVFECSTPTTDILAPREDVTETEQDAIWTHDNVLWLLEEMLVVKERPDKHLLKNRVVFREIADVFNSEGLIVDWREILRKWQSMFIVYSKILRKELTPDSWPYFEHMHSILHDTDMYVGVGIKKQEHLSLENLSAENYVYLNTDDETSCRYIIAPDKEVGGNTADSPLLLAPSTKDVMKIFEINPPQAATEYVVSSLAPNRCTDVTSLVDDSIDTSTSCSEVVVTVQRYEPVLNVADNQKRTVNVSKHSVSEITSTKPSSMSSRNAVDGSIVFEEQLDSCDLYGRNEAFIELKMDSDGMDSVTCPNGIDRIELHTDNSVQARIINAHNDETMFEITAPDLTSNYSNKPLYCSSSGHVTMASSAFFSKT